jgi:hypothetical protein
MIQCGRNGTEMLIDIREKEGKVVELRRRVWG